MAKAISWALDSQSEVKAVYYEGASVIYEGMPVCYNFDTTNNWTGYGAATLAASKTYQGTTAEGEMNEGKYIRVEDPAADNLLHFAGVVAGTKKAGQSGPCVLDIYIPNGAVVPVRAYVECTKGKTVLSIISAVQYLGQPLSATQARPVAIAMETNATLDSTVGLILARLCPKEFIYQELTGDALDVAVAGTSAIVVNRINITSAQTGGLFNAFDCEATVSAGGYSEGGGLAAYFQATISGTSAGKCNAVGIWTNVTGGTHASNLCALEVGLWTDQSLASAGWVTPLCIRDELSTGPTAASHFMMVFICDGAGDHPDGMFLAQAADDIALTSAASVTTAAKIAFKVGTAGAFTTYYIPCGTTTS